MTDKTIIQQPMLPSDAVKSHFLTMLSNMDEAEATYAFYKSIGKGDHYTWRGPYVGAVSGCYATFKPKIIEFVMANHKTTDNIKLQTVNDCFWLLEKMDLWRTNLGRARIENIELAASVLRSFASAAGYTATNIARPQTSGDR